MALLKLLYLKDKLTQLQIQISDIHRYWSAQNTRAIGIRTRELYKNLARTESILLLKIWSFSSNMHILNHKNHKKLVPERTLRYFQSETRSREDLAALLTSSYRLTY